MNVRFTCNCGRYKEGQVYNLPGSLAKRWIADGRVSAVPEEVKKRAAPGMLAMPSLTRPKAMA